MFWVVGLLILALVVTASIFYYQVYRSVHPQTLATQNLATQPSSSAVASSSSTSNSTNDIFPQWLILPSSPIISGQVNENGYHKDYEASGFFMSPSGKQIGISSSTYNQIFAGNSQQNQILLSGFEMPIDPVDSSTIFFSTGTFVSLSSSSSNIDTINRIYAYNLQTSALALIYQESDHNNDPFNDGSGRILETIGIDGSKLILFEDSPGNSGGPCTELWSDAPSQFLYLELSNIPAGLQHYQIPQAMIQNASSSEQQCIQQLDNTD
jgi:hypothetical protein